MAIVDNLKLALQGEPLRAIIYGAAVVIWLVTNAAVAAGYHGFGDPVNVDQALLVATGAAASATELARRFVFSPITVERIIDAVYQAGAQGKAAPTAEVAAAK